MKKTKRIIMLVIAIILTLGGVYLYERQFMDKQIENVFDEMYYSGAPEWTGYKIKREVSWNKTKCVKRTERGIRLIDDSQAETFVETCLPNELSLIVITYNQDNKFQIRMVKEVTDSENLILTYNYNVDYKTVIIRFAYNVSTNPAGVRSTMNEYYEKYQTDYSCESEPVMKKKVSQR